MEHFTNRSAINLWIAAPVALVVAGVGTFWGVQRGLPEKNAMLVLGMICVIWLIVLGLVYLALTTGITHVRVERDKSVSIVRRYPHKADARRLVSDQLNPAELIVTPDVEGATVYTARVTVKDGDEFNLMTTTSRERCEEACWRFNSALFGSS